MHFVTSLSHADFDSHSALSRSLRGVRILLVGNDPEYFLMHRLPLARELAREGADLHVAIPFEKEDRRFFDLGFTLHCLSLKRGSLNILRERQTVGELWRLSNQLRPKLVHHITIKPVLYGSCIARHLGTPAVVNSITGLGYIFTSANTRAVILKKLLVPIMRYGCDRPNVTMLFENADDLALYCSFGIAKQRYSKVVPSSGIDPGLFEPRQHGIGRVTVMLLGRMLWDKGVGEFVHAAQLVKHQCPDARFVMVGGTDPNPESISPETLRKWHDAGVVEYWGWRSDIPNTLSCADILCLPSYREGLPRSLLEGAAAGLALVTTDVPGCRDAIRSGVSALVVPPRDGKALAEAILKLASNAELRQLLGAAARSDVVERFSVNSVIEQTRHVYMAALARC